MDTGRDDALSADATSSAPGRYLVVARRYRPRRFEELVGQQQVAQPLANAITSNRVGHAYLFTGARGVGKTSAARILAKCLNCPTGPTPAPDNDCDICRRIDAGEDVDVLEIDGASNRGIDEIRQLRSNVQVRPSRSRYKIYIIDEVHMLTTPAFNALLKTLEEPPEHVKFIFCTTDPEKIPLTVRSRCQRFDFAPIDTEAILERLQQITEAEGVSADADALRLLARRAGGSMRDSQSLLEQLLAFSRERITLDDVHAMLGTAHGGRLTALAERLADRDVAGALAELDAALAEGVDAGQLAEQLLGHYRDVMAMAVGCDAALLLHHEPEDRPALEQLGQRVGVETLLAGMQILDQAIARMRASTHVRTLVELALVRIGTLERLDELAALIQQVSHGEPAKPTPSGRSTPRRSTQNLQKKTEEISSPPSIEQPEHSQERAIGVNEATAFWTQAVKSLQDMTSDFAACYDRLAISAPNRLVVYFRQEYNLQKEACERPDRKRKLEQAITAAAGQSLALSFELLPAEAARPSKPPAAKSTRQRMREKEQHPLVSQAIELFDAEMVRLETGRRGDEPLS